MKHTQGKWFVDYQQDTNEAVVRAKDGCIVANLEVDYSESWNGKREESEILANAKLIAAAPELLEACKISLGLLHELYSQDIISGWSGESQLESAIRKATE